MFILEIVRPNTLGVTQTLEYEKYSDLEAWLEPYIERRADAGWNACEISGSTSIHGAIELTHDNEGDVIIVRWKKDERGHT